ncbi:Cell division protein FtsQ [Candidatus Rhabdochlamydia sp. T3358]|nr:Cell division protein FtsQ [Candidatus Rhabdochlamydia sp. T3358]
MMSRLKLSRRLPLSYAIGWIIVSTLLCTGGSFAYLKQYLKKKYQKAFSYDNQIHSIIQTGPQKEALKTEYLAEILQISRDVPTSVVFFNEEVAKQRLLSSPLINQADVKVLKPAALYIDYTIRQPVAWVEDYENVVMDKAGYPFPFYPFLSPKNLPYIYFGLSSFGKRSTDSDKPVVRWKEAMTGAYVNLAFSLLQLIHELGLSHVVRIDLSQAFASSCGKREIVLTVDNVIVQWQNGLEQQIVFPHLLRLGTKNYKEQLINYLNLKEGLIEQEKKSATLQINQPFLRLREKVIDLRLSKLAFVQSAS